MRESLLFVTENDGRRSICLLPILKSSEPAKTKGHYGLMMERLGSDCAFRLVKLSEVNTQGARSLTDGPVSGCLGVFRRAGEDFVCVVTKCSLVADLGSSLSTANTDPLPTTATKSRRIYRIDRVAFYGIGSDKHDNVMNNADAYVGAEGEAEVLSDPTGDITVYLSSGSFYFSYDHDLTQSVQREEEDVLQSWRTCSTTFFWNAFLLDPVREFAEGLGEEHLQFIEHGGLFLVAMQGFIQASTVPYMLNAPGDALNRVSMAVVSRLSCHRAGTRFRARGIDDDGHVANFVETEVIILDDRVLFSYIILRGSVPLFWDQQGLQFGRPTFQITRSAAATQPAFDRHMDRLTRQYGLVHCLDLLGQKPGSAEQLLSAAFRLHSERYPSYPDDMSTTQFDVNAVCRGEDLSRVASIMPVISQDLQIFGHFYSQSGRVERTQKGVFRVNCQDCLDRTNLIQGYVARTVVELFVRQVLISSERHLDVVSLLNALSDLWANNGDALSMIYTGTGALRSGFTRSGRRTLAGLMDDVRKTAQRFYVNNFQDKTRQQAVDILLGKLTDQERVQVFNPIAKAVMGDLALRIDEYSELSSIKVLAISWNCNGAVPRDSYDTNCLLELITCQEMEEEQLLDIIAISFQEIVELSATQMMSVDPERRLEWEAFLHDALNNLSDCHYSLLVSNQLVGTSLSLFVREDCIQNIRGVEIASVKTGFGGMTGNKGSVGIRLDYHDTSICFIGSHFTAGQQYASDRNREYSYITSSLAFSKQRMISSHDTVIWMGDFNYRLDISPDTARSLINDRQYNSLLSHDQLIKSQNLKLAFSDWTEGPINFPPTYKYDLHSSQYDTSEKMRTPSYCDRILVRNAGILWYGRAGSIDLSDHRPVKALIQIDTRKIDRSRLESIQAALFSQYIDNNANVIEQAQIVDDIVPESVLEKVEQVLEEDNANKKPPLPDRPDCSAPAPELPSRPAIVSESPHSATLSIQERINQLSLQSPSNSPSGEPVAIPTGIVQHRLGHNSDTKPPASPSSSPSKPVLHPVTPGSM